MATNSAFSQEYNDVSGTGKLSAKVKESPFMPIGIASLVAICGVGAYKFRHRGEMSKSMFLMQLRVTAQGAVVGALCCGLIYQLATKFINRNEQKAVIDK